MQNKLKFLTLIMTAMILVACQEEKGAVSPAPAQDQHAHEEENHDQTRDGHGEDEHDDHGEAEDIVALTSSEAVALGIEIRTAALRTPGAQLRLPAEIRYDADRVANIAAPISGIVRRIDKSEGDTVTEGEELAVISSRELADLKAEYLSTRSAEQLARSELAREEGLFADNITAESDLLTARASFARARTSREAAETKLHALGLGHDVIDTLQNAEDGALSMFTVTSPIDGEIVRRDLTLGEAVDEGAGRPLFVVADTSVVWADLAVFKADLSNVARGTNVSFVRDDGYEVAAGEISFVSPLIDEASRTATARVVLDNPRGELRPGLFLTAIVQASETGMVLMVPEDAVQTVEGSPSVFVPRENGFAPMAVTLGQRSDGQIEIIRGLSEGDRYVVTGAFTLKAELEKSAFGDGHNH
ncbi:efflux RND transporter periplasmic adaptor subunit [Parvularcula sp. LCG005]|uniref:efflux RND transporter periplasmic adaptor subunit n=1 Tax=Parvularcula sp. LCG005 TaxID=3078805 RepID=UPI0029439C34|nr:efflux RND transporter periplasmic adaptor subunit [Parvularcula sp. LCG005]WOI52983.1 efflux RND transporter periplasmic adaptor subunit [Parvularcula sp. LCG005]